MSMERIHSICDTHTKNITAVIYNPVRHEILVGFEDGYIKAWDYSTGEPGQRTRASQQHQGWVTSFLYWSEAKLILSSGNDGFVLAWGSAGALHAKIKVGCPVYCMVLNIRRGHLMIGSSKHLTLYHLLDPNKEVGQIVAKKAEFYRSHSDIIKSIVCHETRCYSAGLDKRLNIYETFAHPTHKQLKLVASLYPAHDAGINCLSLAKDAENNTWLLSGGFDKVVKVWSMDGQVLHRFECFTSAVTSLCYVGPTKTIWVCAGSQQVFMFDPKSGDNVTEFMGTVQDQDEDVQKYSLLQMHYIADLSQVVGTTSRRHMLFWKSNPCGCITALHNRHGIESITYTKKAPILMFTGDATGQIIKWERLQSNKFMYSKEVLSRMEAVSKLAAQIAELYAWVGTDTKQIKDKLIKDQQSGSKSEKNNDSSSHESNTAILKMVFVEDLDLLVVASEDNNIYVWGFDEEAVKVLAHTNPVDCQLNERYGILIANDDQEKTNNKEKVIANDSITNRVAGFICKRVFTEHTQPLTGLAIISKGDSGAEHTYMIESKTLSYYHVLCPDLHLSAGWDRRVLLWNLDQMCLHDCLKNPETSKEQLGADGIITDLDYCASRNEFAYSSSDKLVYVRKFSTDGTMMNLVSVLQGHEAEVTQVRWNDVTSQWITGSLDGTLRVWSEDGVQCQLAFSTQAAVICLCIDQTNGCIVAGVEDLIRVYDTKSRKLVQTNVGHTDAIRCVIHIADWQQYVSVSWDKTVRVWNAYRQAPGERSTFK